MEIDLPRLYQIVQQCGGLNAVIEKERWHQVADIMKIPKLAHDRITKLDYIYCKYLLPYDVLSHGKMISSLIHNVCVHMKMYHVVGYRKGDIGQNRKKNQKCRK